MKTRSRSTATNVFHIYRKEDKTKSVLYPIDPNYSIKNAFNDLFPVWSLLAIIYYNKKHKKSFFEGIPSFPFINAIHKSGVYI
jgi:hypothetical protein